MDTVMALVLVGLMGYCLGSINSAVIVSRITGKDDIRHKGSGNAGMTNMFRVYGKAAGLVTALGDFLKAVAAVLLARFLVGLVTEVLPFDVGYVAGLFVMIGHIYPVFFRFKGGKGVMPALGIILMVQPLVFAILLVIALPVFFLFRIVSLVSVQSAVLLPPVTLAVCLLQGKDPIYQTGFMIAYAVLVLVSHRTNIRRLLQGTEKPIVPKVR
jgi:acyl phosphate:glycerol-3-phosphate acyltransferase